MKPLLIYAHMHRRKTGVTASLIQVLPGFDPSRFELYTYGAKLVAGVERLGSLALLRKLRGRSAIWSAHRNNEVMAGLLYRLLFRQLKVVATRHSATPPSGLTRWLLARADAVIGLTESALQYLPPGTTVIPHGIDLRHYNLEHRKAQSLTGVTQSRLIGVVGRVRKEKGQDILLSAVAPLLKTNPDWGVVVLGMVKPSQHAYQQQLEAIVREAGVATQVHFVGQVEDTADYYRAFDILAVPSLTEGFSMVTLEGMACGCVPVATRGVGIHDDAIKDAVNGWLVMPGDVGSMREAIQQAMNEPQKLVPMSKAANRTVVEDWSREKAIERLSAFYLSLLE